MTIDSQSSGARVPRWLYRALIASFAVNLLFIGGVGAAIWHHRHGPGPMGFVKSLPQDRQTVVREQIEAARASLRPLRTSMREAWGNVKTAIAADPFDKQALKTALQRLAESDAKLKTSLSDSIADTAEKLEPGERRLFLLWVEKRGWNFLGRSGRRFRGDEDGPGPGDDRKP